MSNKKEINTEELEKVTGGLPQAVETTNHPELGKGYWFYFSIVLTKENNRVVEMGKGGFLSASTRDSSLNAELAKVILPYIFDSTVNALEIGYNE